MNEEKRRKCRDMNKRIKGWWPDDDSSSPGSVTVKYVKAVGEPQTSGRPRTQFICSGCKEYKLSDRDRFCRNCGGEVEY